MLFVKAYYLDRHLNLLIALYLFPDQAQHHTRDWYLISMFVLLGLI